MNQIDTSDAQARFARRITHALDRSAAALPADTLERLASARKAALRVQRTAVAQPVPVWQAVPAGVRGGRGPSRYSFLRAVFAASALLIVGVGVAGIYQVEQERRIEDLAELDSAVLNDDLPISEYADHGFNAFLKQNP